MLNYAFKPLLQSIKDNHCTQVFVPGVGETVGVQGEEVKPLAIWTGHTSLLTAVTVLPDGTVVSVSNDKTLRHWDPKTGQCLNTWTGHTDAVNAVTVLPDGTVVSGSWDTTLRHWDPQTGQCLNTWTGHTDRLSAVTVLPDGTVVSGSWDNTLRQWDPQSGQCLNTWTGHTGSVYAVTVLLDGTVVSGSEDTTLRHWDPQKGQCLNTWTGHTDRVRAVTVLPDGTVVSGSFDNTLRHWDPQTGQCLNTWTGHTSPVYAVTVLPDGSVVSGCLDKTLRHWDPQTGQCLNTWTGHTSIVCIVTVLPDGTVVSGSFDNTLRHWPRVGPTLTVAQLHEVLQTLSSNTSVTTLSITDAAFTDITVALLVQGLQHHRTLSALTLKRCGLTASTAVPLLKALMASESGVTRLSLEMGEVCLQADSREAVQQVVGDFLAKGAPDALPKTLSPALQQASEGLADNHDTTALEKLDMSLDDKGRTALMLSIAQGKYNLATLLMLDSPLDVADKSGDTVLHYLVQQAKSDERDGLIVRLLSEGVDEEATNDKQQTPEKLLEEKEPGHYRVLMRRMQRQQRQQLRRLETRLTALEAIEVQRENQLREALGDEEVQKQLCSPKKVYLRRLFLASVPALASIDKEAQDSLVPKKSM